MASYNNWYGFEDSGLEKKILFASPDNYGVNFGPPEYFFHPPPPEVHTVNARIKPPYVLLQTSLAIILTLTALRVEATAGAESEVFPHPDRRALVPTKVVEFAAASLMGWMALLRGTEKGSRIRATSLLRFALLYWGWLMMLEVVMVTCVSCHRRMLWAPRITRT